MPSCFLFNEDGHFVPAWVHIHDLPMDCSTIHVVSIVRSKIGRRPYTDKLTQTRERLTFAHLLIEIDVEGDKVTIVSITLPIGVQLGLQIKYEIVALYCKKCR